MYVNYLFIIRLLLLIIVLNIFIFFSSCTNKSIISFEEDIKKLMIWSDNGENFVNSSRKFIPVSSKTLAEMAYLEYFNYEEGFLREKTNKGVMIGVLNFNNNEFSLNDVDKDLLVLISKAQKYEEFNILIEANNIKFNTSGIIDIIEKNLISNGVIKDNISVSNINNSKDNLIIKIIKKL